MEIYTKENKCSHNERDILATDGTHVCTQCGVVQDMICFENYEDSSYQITRVNPFLLEVCHRLEIDSITKNDANKIYIKAVLEYPYLRKHILMSTSIYIATKKNLVPRTLKEISVASGINVKKIGDYERMICRKYYPVNATEYIYRFGTRLNMTFSQINKIDKEIQGLEHRTKIQNPVLLCATYLYKFMNQSNKCLIQIQEVTGIPVSTLKRAYKKEFKTC